MYGFIYKIENLINKKVYIGQTTKQKPSKREKEHYRQLINDNHYNSHLQYAFNKYGKSNFKFNVLNWANSKTELNILEVYFINKYDALNSDKGYNIREGGSNGKLSDKTKQKLSENAKERFKNPMNNPMYGKRGKLNPNYGKKRPETSKKLSGKNHHFYGKKRPDVSKFNSERVLTDETKLKIGKANSGRNSGWFGKTRSKHGFKGTRYSNQKYPPWKRVWQSIIMYNKKVKSLGYFEDPLSAEIVHTLVWTEIYG